MFKHLKNGGSLLSSASRFLKKHCFFGRFTGFAPSSFWQGQQVGLEEGELGALVV